MSLTPVDRKQMIMDADQNVERAMQVRRRSNNIFVGNNTYVFLHMLMKVNKQ